MASKKRAPLSRRSAPTSVTVVADPVTRHVNRPAVGLQSTRTELPRTKQEAARQRRVRATATHGDQRSRETASEVGNVLPVGEHRLPHHDKLVVAAPGCDESKTLSGREL